MGLKKISQENNYQPTVREVDLKKFLDCSKAYFFEDEEGFLWVTLYESLKDFSKKDKEYKKVSEILKSSCHNYGAFGVDNPNDVFFKLNQNWFLRKCCPNGIEKNNEYHLDWQIIEECIKQINWKKEIDFNKFREE